MKQSEGWGIELIKKIRSRLSVKVFTITILITAICCMISYGFLLWFVPNIYQYDLDEAEPWITYLPDSMSEEPKENAPIWFEEVGTSIKNDYDGEFELHLFQTDGQEVSLQDVDQLIGGKKTDYDNVEKTEPYLITFVDDDSSYTILMTRNLTKRTQTEDALGKALPGLCIVIFAVSIITALFYSLYMTAPIKRISRISKQMADMDFSGLCTVKRTDEIGVLANSLNKLSGKLSMALTELQEANQKLQADIEKERQLEKQRLEFFSAASHELKTPITIIRGQLQGMLCQVGRYKDRETYLAQSLETTNTLEQMVQELLTISRLDTPGYGCKKSYFDFEKLLKTRLDVYEDLIIQKDLSLEKALSLHTPLFGDEALLQKVVNNLLSNAIAYSPAGSEIFVKLWSEAEGVYFTIENTNVHIPEKAIPKLFEAFYRVDQSRNRQTGGSGLGLYIVKAILDLHDAEIWVENTLRGVCTVVHFK